MYANKHASDYKTYVNNFKGECANIACRDATTGVFGALNGVRTFEKCNSFLFDYD